MDRPAGAAEKDQGSRGASRRWPVRAVRGRKRRLLVRRPSTAGRREANTGTAAPGSRVSALAGSCVVHCPVPNYHPDACRSLGCPSPHEVSPDVTCITFLALLHGSFQNV